MYRAEFRRLACGEVPIFAARHLRTSGIYGLRILFNLQSIWHGFYRFIVDIWQYMSRNPDEGYNRCLSGWENGNPGEGGSAMGKLSVFVVPLVAGVVGLCPSTLCLAQFRGGAGILPAGAAALVGSVLSGVDQGQPGPDAPGRPDTAQTPERTRQAVPRLGIAVKMSTLGVGIEGATAVTRRSNARVGFNA